MTGRISSAGLRARLLDENSGEFALIDVREEGVFCRGHLLFAVCIPLSRLELRIRALAPRRSAPVVLCDGGDGLAARAAKVLSGFGYTDVSVLEGGTPAWEASGGVLFGGVNVPSKAFGEFVEHREGTPNVSADELKALIDSGTDMVVLDSRPLAEYRRMNIPTGIDCPGAELAYRVHDVAPDPATLVVVNCAGRTRSIIGAQSLRNAGIPNRVAALCNGTMGWALAGHALETGKDRFAPDPSPDGLKKALAAAARVAKRFGVRTIDTATLAQWRNEAETRSLFLLDVRNPEEFAAGHMPGSVSAPGGQLVQATDRYVGTLRSRLVLIDDNGVRATMTASWLIQMGWPEVVVLKGGLDDAAALETGVPEPEVPGLEDAQVESVKVGALAAALKAGEATAVDLATSLEYRAGHIPGAWWAVRARLGEALANIPGDGTLVFTATEPALAVLAAADAASLTRRPVAALTGGNAAWRAAGGALNTGSEHMACRNDDVFYRAYDYEEGEADIAAKMQEYIDWETGLVAQVERDGTARFRAFPP
ncbi:MAG: thiosulfate sulfurtransferase [Alphaproteobacteria bacterium]|nr:thiosulfate sulfurtransferase [Alphaproteobacteria bacterium]